MENLIKCPLRIFRLQYVYDKICTYMYLELPTQIWLKGSDETSPIGRAATLPHAAIIILGKFSGLLVIKVSKCIFPKFIQKVLLKSVE